MAKTTVYQGKADIAKTLLAIGAVTLSPHQLYTWASGIKSPIYCDNRLILSSPIARTAIIQAFENFARQDLSMAEGIAGTATAGIPHAALVADRLGLPMVYVRSSAKSHGKQNQVEGRVLEGQRLVVMEDTISTGGSVLTAVEALREMGAIVHQVMSVFTYGFPNSIQAFQEAGVSLYTLTDYATLIGVAQESGLIKDGEAELLQQFYQDPWSFGK